MGKDTTIISDLRIFFSKNDTSRAISSIMGVMEYIKIRSGQIGVTKKANCKLTALQVFNLLVLFPFFMVKNASSFAFSSLGRLFMCEKDMFYRFMNDGNVNWRSLLYSMSQQLVKCIRKQSTRSSADPVCLIIDDTDAPKTGVRTELIGRVWSHVLQKSILGYKCLTLMLSDGCSQMFIDFSLHGEQGKNKEKVQGLTAGQRKARFSKDYKGQAVQERVDEYLRKKTETAIGMITNAIKRGFPVRLHPCRQLVHEYRPRQVRGHTAHQVPFARNGQAREHEVRHRVWVLECQPDNKSSQEGQTLQVLPHTQMYILPNRRAACGEEGKAVLLQARKERRVERPAHHGQVHHIPQGIQALCQTLGHRSGLQGLQVAAQPRKMPVAVFLCTDSKLHPDLDAVQHPMYGKEV